MKLDLVNRWSDLRSLQNPVEMLRKIVADANRLGKSLFLQLLHLLPFLLVLGFVVAEEGCMNQVATMYVSAIGKRYAC
jgi:hypothetical protein